MKKILPILIFLMVLSACTTKNAEQLNVEKPVNNVISTSSVNIDYQLRTSLHPMRIPFIRTEDGQKYYYDVPKLNEIAETPIELYVSDDGWLLSFACDYNEKAEDIDTAKDAVFEWFFKGVSSLFTVDDIGFVQISSNQETHSDLEMLKIEGKASDINNADQSDCWIYGYIFILEGRACSFVGMNLKNDSEKNKENVVTYIDHMADTLRSE